MDIKYISKTKKLITNYNDKYQVNVIGIFSKGLIGFLNKKMEHHMKLVIVFDEKKILFISTKSSIYNYSLRLYI
jgi:hypothetical protein